MFSAETAKKRALVLLAGVLASLQLGCGQGPSAYNARHDAIATLVRVDPDTGRRHLCKGALVGLPPRFSNDTEGAYLLTARHCLPAELRNRPYPASCAGVFTAQFDGAPARDQIDCAEVIWTSPEHHGARPGPGGLGAATTGISNEPELAILRLRASPGNVRPLAMDPTDVSPGALLYFPPAERARIGYCKADTSFSGVPGKFKSVDLPNSHELQVGSDCDVRAGDSGLPLFTQDGGRVRGVVSGVFKHGLDDVDGMQTMFFSPLNGIPH